jgi:hypothetical protein
VSASVAAFHCGLAACRNTALPRLAAAVILALLLALLHALFHFFAGATRFAFFHVALTIAASGVAFFRVVRCMLAGTHVSSARGMATAF